MPIKSLLGAPRGAPSPSMITNPEIVAELSRIADRNDGCLLPEAVVEAARREKSPLHSWFQWDDTDAAHQWRLHQARNLIRVVVSYVPVGNSQQMTRVFVSLTPDRPEGNGYRATAAVLADPKYRNQLLSDAMEEMTTFERKYASLQELAAVFAAMRQTARKLARAT